MTNKRSAATPVWKAKTLEELTGAEWESLCDGCARCCLVKLEDEDTGAIHFTDIGCTLLDAKACRCRDYSRRTSRVPDCVKLTPAAVRTLTWLPVTCAYRLISENKDLPDWHPLVSGSSETVHEAGISVRDRVFAVEDNLAEESWPDRIVLWPNQAPRRRRKGEAG